MDEKGEPTTLYPSKWISLLAVGAGIFVGTLDMSIVNVSLPTLVQDLHTTFSTIQWVILGYVLVVTSMMLGAARLGDMFVKKRLYAAGLALFTIGSLLCGFSPTVEWLIAFRVLQGCGAVITQALGMAIIVEVFPASERGRALGLTGSIVSVGLAMGPAIGGIIVGMVGWRWIFWVNVPICIFAIIVVLRSVPAFMPQETRQRFDARGAFVLLVTLACYALAMTMGQNMGFGNGLVQALLVAAGVGMAGFLVLERSIDQPMVDLGLFKNTFFSINLVMGLLTFVVLGGGIFILPFFLQLVLGYPPYYIGLLLMVVPTTVGLVAPIAGALSDRYGPRGISLVGLLVMAFGCFSISTFHAELSAWGYIIRVIPMGLGIGLFQSPNNSAVMGAAPVERLGVASGLLALSRNLGQTTGIPFVGSLFTAISLASARVQSMNITALPAKALVAGLSGTYHVTGTVVLVAAGLAFFAFYKERKKGVAV
jgi:EmrB/QacA subfamily drug resistance transporter